MGRMRICLDGLKLCLPKGRILSRERLNEWMRMTHWSRIYCWVTPTFHTQPEDGSCSWLSLFCRSCFVWSILMDRPYTQVRDISARLHQVPKVRFACNCFNELRSKGDRGVLKELPVAKCCEQTMYFWREGLVGWESTSFFEIKRGVCNFRYFQRGRLCKEGMSESTGGLFQNRSFGWKGFPRVDADHRRSIIQYFVHAKGRICREPYITFTKEGVLRIC